MQKRVGSRWVAVASKYTNGQGMAYFNVTPPAGHSTSSGCTPTVGMA